MPFTYHRNRLTYGLDLRAMQGVEIGPLVNPMVTRDVSDVRYVDRASTADLREWYAKDPNINVDDIMDIDYIWGHQSLAQATAGTEQFDYCIASHVIEHIPDLITWLGEIASILKVGGVACFAVPDKRYTFDYLRPVTTVAELVDSYLNKLRKPSFRHIYDHFSNFAELDIETAWSHGFDGSQLKPINTLSKVYNTCLNAQETGKYVDSHCSVFTEDTFFDLLRSISEIGMLDFKVRRNFSTKPGMFEFFVQLEKIDSGLSKQDKLALFDESLEKVNGAVLEIDFICSEPCTPKIYYNTGEGFTETETLETQYYEANKLQTLKYVVPGSKHSELRFDPADSDVSLTISRLDYAARGGDSLNSLSAIKPLTDIAKFKLSRKKVMARAVKGATDPAFLIAV